MLNVLSISPLTKFANCFDDSDCKFPQIDHNLRSLPLKLLQIFYFISNLAKCFKCLIPLTNQICDLCFQSRKIMNISQILLEMTDQLFLLSLALCIFHKFRDDLINMKLLATWKPFCFPMTLNHSDDPSKLCGLPEALNLLGLIDLNLLIILINDCNTTLLRLDFLSVFQIKITELDPFTIWLRHLHTIDSLDSLQIVARQIICTTLNCTFSFVFNYWVHLLHLRAR